MKQELEERVQRAVELFMNGYGCCQSVVAAFADMYGLDDQMSKRVCAGFGGGVGRMRMMCGTVSGLVVLAGLEKGQTEGDDKDGKAACYKLVQDLLARFREEKGSLICSELLQLRIDHPVTHVPDERNAEYYRVRPCARNVECAAGIFAEYLDSKAD